MKRFSALLLLAALAACESSFEPLALDPANPASPETAAFNQGAAGGPGFIPGQFIVTLRDGANPSAVASEFGVEPRYVYRAALNGFAGSISEAARAGLMRDGRVLRIEQDQVMHLWQTTQSNATWGLDRIDQRNLPLNGTYVYDGNGAGVRAYIVDSGIRFAHNDFGGRAVPGIDMIGDGQNGNDCNGHGTHVAGTVGGSTWGVAKGVQLVSVRVFGCTGGSSVSMIAAALDWITDSGVKPAVVNMSLGGGASATLDDAVRRSVQAGFSYVVAAGNGNFIGRQADACNYSPARVAEAMTVSATSSNDAKASWANFGNCVDLFAPGVSITSAWHTGNSATNTISGTSMAAPHAAGVAALYLQANQNATPSQVFQAIRAETTKGVVTNSSTSKNDMLYSRIASGGTEPPPPPPNQPPTASFMYSCTDLACNFNGSASSDPDGSIVSYAWNFGDGSSGSGITTSRTYASAGTRTVTLTVTDNDGATGSTSQSVTVTAPGSGGISLSVSAYKIQGRKHADLTWTGAASTNVDIFRDNVQIATTANNGAFTHSTNERGGGSHTYRVCEANTSTCSQIVTASY